MRGASRQATFDTVPIFQLDERLLFPDPRLAREDGLLAVGGDLDPRRLLLGYSMGIFPWYNEGQPILWHSPDPRFVLFPNELRVQRSLRKVLRKRPYRMTMDQAFPRVLDGCARTPRPRQSGTWITSGMRRAYLRLHDEGAAHSVELWDGDTLVGGLYGVGLGRVYFGESMFSLAPDASKVGFVALVRQLARWKVQLIDSQVYTDHVERFGGRLIPRAQYLARLNDAIAGPLRRGKWSFDEDLLDDPELLIGAGEIPL